MDMSQKLGPVNAYGCATRKAKIAIAVAKQTTEMSVIQWPGIARLPRHVSPRRGMSRTPMRMNAAVGMTG